MTAAVSERTYGSILGETTMEHCTSGRAMSASDCALVLHVQTCILRFLWECCILILHDKAIGPLDERIPAVPEPPPLPVHDNAYGRCGLGGIATAVSSAGRIYQFRRDSELGQGSFGGCPRVPVGLKRRPYVLSERGCHDDCIQRTLVGPECPACWPKISWSETSDWDYSGRNKRCRGGPFTPIHGLGFPHKVCRRYDCLTRGWMREGAM